MRVPTIQEDCCGHGGERPEPPSLGLGLISAVDLLGGGLIGSGGVDRGCDEDRSW